jgi:CRP/FNR family cyclic AMP-dependent transcriptional regulator
MEGNVRDSTACVLADIELFSTLDSKSLAAVEARCRQRQYARDESIVSHHEISTEVFFILSGAVRILLYSPAGKEISFRDLVPGDLFGELAAVDGQSRSATVIALADTELAVLSSDDFWNILRTNPEVSASLIKRLAHLIRFYSMRLYEFGTLGVEDRVHAELLRLSQDYMLDDNSAIISPIPTHAVIASRISTRREAVAREMSALTRSGLLIRNAKSLVISDFRKLRAMVEEARGE